MRGAAVRGEVHGGHALLLIISILQSGQAPAPSGPPLPFHSRSSTASSAGSSGGDRGGDFRKQRAPARRHVCLRHGRGGAKAGFLSRDTGGAWLSKSPKAWSSW